MTGRLSAADLAGTGGKHHAGSGITVAVIDSGVDQVPALAGRVIQGPDFTGTGPQDNYGHGTFLAGLIAGNGQDANGNQTGLRGVAPGADILSIKVTDANGQSTVGTVVKAISWVIANAAQDHIRVMNLSLGAPAPGQSYDTLPLDAAVEAAWMSGITVVTSAGNNTPTVVDSPANDPFVITAGAVHDSNNWNPAGDTLAPFSPAASPTVDGFIKPDVFPPGEHLQAPLPSGTTLAAEQTVTGLPAGYGQMSGTSLSAAVLSGEVAVLLSDHPSWTPDQVKGALLSTAHSNGEPNLKEAIDSPGLVLADQNVRPSLELLDAYVTLIAHTPPSAVNWATLDLSSVNWALADFSQPTWLQPRWTSIAPSPTASQATWADATWADATWADATWTNATWSNATWSNATWSNATWSNATWSNATWTNATWSNSTWSDATWSNASGNT
ncbi:MAG: S8 family serine peptidase [Mycobacteriales bacterium]